MHKAQRFNSFINEEMDRYSEPIDPEIAKKDAKWLVNDIKDYTDYLEKERSELNKLESKKSELEDRISELRKSVNRLSNRVDKSQKELDHLIKTYNLSI
jgi:peptidoglycan hydrolase CwlO-like protein